MLQGTLKSNKVARFGASAGENLQPSRIKSVVTYLLALLDLLFDSRSDKPHQLIPWCGILH